MGVKIISTTFQRTPLIISGFLSGTNNHMRGALLKQYSSPTPPLLEHQKVDFLVQMNLCSLKVQVVAVTFHSPPRPHLFYQDQTFIKDIYLHPRFIHFYFSSTENEKKNVPFEMSYGFIWQYPVCLKFLFLCRTEICLGQLRWKDSHH